MAFSRLVDVEHGSEYASVFIRCRPANLLKAASQQINRTIVLSLQPSNDATSLDTPLDKSCQFY